MKRQMIVWILWLLVMGSCRTKKVLTEKIDRVQSDTLIMKTETVRQKPISGQLIIREICDTITGQARDFQQVFTQGPDTIRLGIQDGDFVLNMSQIDSVRSVAVSEFRSTFDREKKEKATEVTRVVAPGWIWYSLGLNIMLILGIGFYIGKRFRII